MPGWPESAFCTASIDAAGWPVAGPCVTGACAADTPCGVGGGSAETKPFNATSYLEGISNRLGTRVKVLYDVDVPVLDPVFENSEFVTAPGGESGLKGEYFDNEDFKGTPVLVRTDRHVHFDWGEGSVAPGQPVDHFAIRWMGT